MPRDYSEAYKELMSIRTDMANVGTYTDRIAVNRDLQAVAAAVSVLAWHITELMQDR